MYRNVTYAFIHILKKVLENGTFIITRGNEQIENLSQLLQMKYPIERVIISHHRNNNIFALIAETMWVIAGRDDLDFLSHYLPMAIDFSDDGKTWRGAYGPRLRNWNGVDQFDEIRRIINNDKNTKRAVMMIYDPQRDYIDSKGKKGRWQNICLSNTAQISNSSTRFSISYHGTLHGKPYVVFR